ncbi:MAG: carboxypeptidase regulatory-like domain-containing protein [Candidatus Sumerlaeia bacterium]|nr:carboxypeptidase regulatory-like domain-containing protein [Candidatus Sumerlaeia bacterium]
MAISLAAIAAGIVVGVLLLPSAKEPTSTEEPPRLGMESVVMEHLRSIPDDAIEQLEATVPGEDPPAEEVAAPAVPMDDTPPEFVMPDFSDVEIIGEVEVSGRVTDRATGEGISGVSIGTRNLEEMGVEFPLPRYSEQRTESDGDGFYTLTLFRYDSPYFGESSMVTVKASGYATLVDMVPVTGEKIKRDYELGESETISGRVVTPDGKPIGSIRVHASQIDRPQQGKPRSFAQGKTDEDGAFALENVEQGLEYRVMAADQVYRQREQVTAMAGDTNVTITVAENKYTLFGTLRDAGGKPVPNATITHFVPVFSGASNQAPAPKTTTNSEGYWELVIRNSPSNMVSAHVSRPPEGSHHEAHTHYSPIYGETIEVDLRLPPTYRIHGRVTKEETGEGFPGVKFMAMRQHFHREEKPDAISGHDGEFSFLIPLTSNTGNYTMEAPEGYQIRTETMKQYISRVTTHINHTLANDPINLYARATGQFYLRLLKAEEGEPIPGQSFHFSGRNYETDEDGIASVHVVLEGTAHVSISADHSQRRFQINLDEIEPGSTHDLVVADTASIGIQLNGPSPEEMVEISGRVVPAESGGSHMGQQWNRQFNERGYLLIENIEPEVVHNVQLRIPMELPWKFTEIIEVTLEAGEFFDTLEIDLEPRDLLEIRVTDADGTPVERYGVGMQQIDQRGRQSHSNQQVNNPQGRTQIPAPESGGRYQRISISSSGYIPTSLTFDSAQPESPLEFTLERAIEVTIHAVDGETGNPVRDPFYSVLTRGSWTHVNNQHRGTEPIVTHVQRPGEYTAHVRRDALGSASLRQGETDFVIAEGETSISVTVELLPSGSLQGRVYSDGDGSAIEGAKISVYPGPTVDQSGRVMTQPFGGHHPGRQMATTKSDGDGLYAFDGIPVGTTQYIVVEKRGFATQRDLEVLLDPDDPEGQFNIAMVPGNRLYGSVTGPGGVSLAGDQVRVTWTHQGGMQVSEIPTGVIDENGEYEIPLDEVGSFNATLTHNHATHTLQGRVEADGDDSQQIRLDFDLVDFVHLSGTAHFNGRPLTTDFTQDGPRWFYLDKVDDSSQPMGPGHVSDVEGGYAMFARPGLNNVLVSRRGMWAHAISYKEIDIPQTPSHQEMDFDFETASAIIGLVFPEPSDFQRGNIRIHGEHESDDTGGNYQATGEEVRIPIVPTGDLVFRFQSEDSMWAGESEEVSIAPGEEAVVVIDVYRNPRLVRIGGWSPETVTHDFSPVEFDITAHADGGREFTVIFKYESGADALSISRAALNINGQMFASRGQSGWAGSTHRQNSFPLTLPSNMAIPEEGIYTIEALIRAGNTMDSTGSVYLLVE